MATRLTWLVMLMLVAGELVVMRYEAETRLMVQRLTRLVQEDDRD